MLKGTILNLTLLLNFFVFYPNNTLFCAPLMDDESNSCVSRGVVHAMKENYTAAINEFSQAILINPKHPIPYYQRAKIYEDIDQMDKALKDYDQAIKCDQEYFQAYYYRGVIYQKKGKLDQAIEDYTRIIDKKPESKSLFANAYNNRGLAYYVKANYGQAVYDFSFAIELIPELLNAYYNRALAHISSNSYSLALADFEKEIELRPTLITAIHYKQALIYYSKNKFEDALREIFILASLGEKISPEFIDDLKKHIKKKNK